MKPSRRRVIRRDRRKAKQSRWRREPKTSNKAGHQQGPRRKEKQR